VSGGGESGGRMGFTTFSYWQAYPWKNELAEQKRRICLLLDEIIEGVPTDHDPAHMIERAIGVAAICMRRLIECRLLTDAFVATPIGVHEIDLKQGTLWREPFLSSTGTEIFNNYDMTARTLRNRLPKMIASKFLHARIISVLQQSDYIPDGILIASDTQRLQGLFHFTKGELSAVFDAFLDNEVRLSQDGFEDDERTGVPTGRVTAVRINAAQATKLTTKSTRF